MKTRGGTTPSPRRVQRPIGYQWRGRHKPVVELGKVGLHHHVLIAVRSLGMIRRGHLVTPCGGHHVVRLRNAQAVSSATGQAAKQQQQGRQ